ncbi:hypothetical protein [Marixanthomonas ophiurae]|uniref:Uncharacterized protein n=1 Tax=Marixanthomonas ophiurae TaxID=387659 RepID=A0A3E1QDB5_9FLAO|nr:hypothetical protein [Marixanthomonas ophiurae]RFN60084.1 hypothetical protein DZ858_08570 [Marixanthomonas ophiurae]
MKKIFLLALLVPFLALSQNSNEYGVFENALLTPNPAQVSQFEKGLAAHNKEYHGEGTYGARVYWVSNGPNTGSYVWVMGPFPWSSLDNRPAQKEGHDADWNTNVAPYTTADSGAQSYWRFNAELSRFSKNFTIKNMEVDTWDIKRGKYKEAMALVKKIHDVYTSKSPEDTYGIYTNEFSSTKEGRDLAVISFFEKSAWLGEDHDISNKYDEMYGAGSWDQFLNDWMEVTNGGETEIWIYVPELSGISGNVKVAERN